MEYYSRKVRKIEKETSEIEYIRCDKCNKKISSNKRFYKVTTSHNSWGNDSVDSIREYDICEKCISKFLKEYFDNAKYGTEEVEVESEYYKKHDKNYQNGYEEYGINNDLVEEDESD